MRDLPKDLGTYIKALRVESGLRQVDLAARARIPRIALIRIESGREVNLSTFLKLTEALGIEERVLEAILPGFSLEAAQHIADGMRKVRKDKRDEYDF